MKNRLSMRSAILISLAILLATLSAGADTNTFCVTGQSTGVGWSVRITGTVTCRVPGEDEVKQEPIDIPIVTLGIREGASSAELAAEFCRIINLILAFEIAEGRLEGAVGLSVEVDKENPGCFVISGIDNLGLHVGPVGAAPDCEVTNNPDGCAFNPTIQWKGAIEDRYVREIQFWLAGAQNSGIWPSTTSPLAGNCLIARSLLQEGFAAHDPVIQACLYYVLQFVASDGSITSGEDPIWETSVAVLFLAALGDPTLASVIEDAVAFLPYTH